MKTFLILALSVCSFAQQGPTAWTHYDIAAANLQYRSYNYMVYLDGKSYLYDGKAVDGTIYSNTFQSWVSSTQTLTSLSSTGGSIQTCTGGASWKANFAYNAIANNGFITDPQGHLQRLTTNGTSGSSQPTWNHTGSTTTDGTAVWTDMGIQPPPRHPYQQWWPDKNRHRIWVVGGVCSGSDPDSAGVANLWYFRTTDNTWQFLLTAHSPTSLLGERYVTGATAFDSDDNITIQYGSDSGGTHHMFAYCPTDLNPIPGTLTTAQTSAGCRADDWIEITTSGATPTAQGQTAFAYTRGGKAIMFGGEAGLATLNPPQTLQYDIIAKTWTLLNSGISNSPPAVPYTAPLKGQPVMAYDTANELLYVWANATGHMWTLDVINGGGKWRDQGASAGPVCATPATDDTGCTEKMIYDAVNNKLVIEAYTNNLGDSTTMWVATLPPYLIGLGASTVTCLDKDGDGYGVGPGCTGPDADDNDATVHTKAQAVAAHGTLNGFFQYKGYYPDKYWILDIVNGNDGTGQSCTPANLDIGGASDCRSYATWNAFKGSVAAGDAVLIRSGTYNTFSIDPVAGTSGTPVYYLGYPGEQPLFNNSKNIQIVRISWIVIDGIKFHDSTSGIGCLNGGTSDGATSLFHNNILRHLDLSGCVDGWVISNASQDILFEENVSHDNDGTSTGGEHGVYLGANETPNTNIVIRRCLLYNNGRSAVHLNGLHTYIYVEDILAYGNLNNTIAIQEGVIRSFFTNIVSINETNTNIQLNTYDGAEGGVSCGVNRDQTCTCSGTVTAPVIQVAGICAFNNMENTFTNITLFRSGVDRNNGPVEGTLPAIGLNRASCTTAFCLASNQPNNIFRNIVITVAGNNLDLANYAPIRFLDPVAPFPIGTTTFDHIVYNQLNGSAVFLQNAGAGKSCAQAASLLESLGSCINADPKFVALGTYATPGAYDFRLQPSSPALNMGTSNSSPVFDFKGTAFGTTPSIGAFTGDGNGSTWTPPTGTAGSPNACDLNGDGVVNGVDVQLGINQALRIAPCTNADLDGDGFCTVIDVQRIIIASLGGACRTGH